MLVTTKLSLPFLEMMVTNVCNLSCIGCTTFSDLDHKGYLSWKDGHKELLPWTGRLDIQSFGFMGGEPLINPDIKNWLQGIRDLLPRAQIRFVTNGILLDKHWWIVDMLDSLGNSVLKISYHVVDPRVDLVIDRIFKSREWTAVNEYGIDRWRSESGIRFQIARPQKFWRTFQGTYHDMRPHDNDPSHAFKVCVQQRCPLLHKGRLYKCGTAGLTGDILDRHGWPNKDQWNQYLDTGLSIDCGDSELQSFVRNFGKPNSICRQCPTTNDLHSQIDHTKTVKFK